MLINSLGLLSLAILGRASSQTVLLERPVAVSHAQSAYDMPGCDDGLSIPVGELSALSFDSFTTLVHPLFPSYSARIKKTVFDCEPGATAYTGYIDIQARHLFFYFFESRNNPETDDVIMWINGGPGCSSSLGLFMENGPCKILGPEGPVYNPYSWTTNASVFYVDQPIGAGFSYADYGETVSTTDRAARDIAAFIALFFENFSQFKGRAFHMAGESYGGHYIPIFAARVYDQNAELAAAGKTEINLKSIIMGNPLVDFYGLYASYIDVQCTTASVSPPVSNISTCIGMKKALPRCQQWALETCINHFDALSCGAARDFCDNQISLPFEISGLNPYDITKKCEGDPSNVCYPVTQYTINYLSNATVREMLGVSPEVPLPFQPCNEAVLVAFYNALDEYHETYTHVAQLLERSVRVLVYVGTYDWICNWISNERWTLKMPWTGQDAFASQPLKDWKIDGHAVGRTRSANGLTFATVAGAGHMVPYDKPKEALVLVQKWLEHQPL